jgi:hypothetical protein
VCDLAGITYRQLDYWARQGLVVPSITEAHGSGTQRRYSRCDVVCARVVKTLSTSGFGQVNRCAPIVDLLREKWDLLDDSSFLVVSGRDVRLLLDPLDVAALSFSTEPLFLIPLGPLLEGLE